MDKREKKWRLLAENFKVYLQNEDVSKLEFDKKRGYYSIDIWPNGKFSSPLWKRFKETERDIDNLHIKIDGKLHILKGKYIGITKPYDGMASEIYRTEPFTFDGQLVTIVYDIPGNYDGVDNNLAYYNEQEGDSLELVPEFVKDSDIIKSIK